MDILPLPSSMSFQFIVYCDRILRKVISEFQRTSVNKLQTRRQIPQSRHELQLEDFCLLEYNAA
jgi:hypothetical protein